jgi:hypothetical protein
MEDYSRPETAGHLQSPASSFHSSVGSRSNGSRMNSSSNSFYRLVLYRRDGDKLILS